MYKMLLLLLTITLCFPETILIPEDFGTIQGGINAASEGDTVLLAAGTYSPLTNSEVFPIDMASGIHLIGSGEDITIIDAQQTNRVITMENCNNNSISNLTLKGGLTDSYGGGIRLDYSNPILTHVNILNNTANWGGGLHSCDSNPTLIHVSILNNEALQGGAMRLIESDLILTYVTISNNTASECGGMRLFDSDPILTHVTISNNTAEYYGGAMWLDYSNPILNNVIISNNIAEYAGGGMRLSNSNPILINVTITNNTAGIYGGGGMYLNSSNPNLTNSIIWGNSPESIYRDSGIPLITYSNIEGAWEGEGNIDADPLFIDPENSDYTLQEGSPCIDAGITDIDGDGVDDITDYIGSAPDMGVFEFGASSTIMAGDTNFDGIIDILDIVRIVNQIMGNSEFNDDEFTAADFNADGIVDILDIVQIVNYILAN